MSDLSGQSLGGYTPQRQIGVGEHGAVYEAASSDGRTFALKVFNERVVSAPGFAQSFPQRAAALKVIGHEAVAPVEAYGAGDPCYLVTSYLPTSLGTLLRRRKSDERTWPLANALAAMRRAAEGLAQAHGQGVLHLNLKPSNLRFGADDAAPNTLQLVDFSIQPLTAEELQSGSASPATLSYAIAPELWLDQPPGPWSDVYALGAMLYEIAVGAPPFNATTPAAAYGSHMSSRPRPPRNVRPDIPRALEQLIEQCLAREPRDRYQSAQQLIKALKEVEDDLQKSPPQVPVAEGTVARAAAPASFEQPSVEVRNAQGDLQMKEELLGDPLRIGHTASDVPLVDATGEIQIWWDGTHVYVESLGGKPPELNKTPLKLNEPTLWPQSYNILLDPYFLRLIFAASPPRNGNGAHVIPETAAISAVEPTKSANRGKFKLETLEPGLVLTPGKQTSTTLVIRNLSGSGVEHLAIRVTGDQRAWILNDPPIKQLNPGESDRVTLSVGVRQEPEPHAGQYATTIQLISQSNNDEVLDEVSPAPRWHVAAFADPQLKIARHRWRSWRTGDYTIRLRNNGNTPAQGTITDVVDENNEDPPVCLFYQEGASDPWQDRVQFELKPGETKRWPLQVRALRLYWLGGRSQRHNVQIKASQEPVADSFSSNDAPLNVGAAPARKIEVVQPELFIQWPIFAPWMLWMLLLLLALCAIGALLWSRLELEARTPLSVVRGQPLAISWSAANVRPVLLQVDAGKPVPLATQRALIWSVGSVYTPTVTSVRGSLSLLGQNLLGFTVTKTLSYTLTDPSATPITQVTVVTAVTPVTQVVTVTATPMPITPTMLPVPPSATRTLTPTATLPPNCQLGSGVQLTNPNGSVAKNAPVLIFIQRRGLDGRLTEVAVGGGVSDAQGRVTLPLALGEPAGFHTFIVRERYTLRLLGEFHCVLFATPLPTAQPTAPPRPSPTTK